MLKKNVFKCVFWETGSIWKINAEVTRVDLLRKLIIN